MSLVEEVNQKRKEIFTDSYPMSIGELSNMYRDGEIEINPAFQRFYRWSATQKVRLIESILLGIPLPSIFVAQREDGVWDLVDGLQRISTIMSFMGQLKNERGDFVDPLVLDKTEYLPSLKDISWEGDNALDETLKRMFKREKIEIKIIKKESDSNTKFELFQRLNTGGSNLSDQEVRNCLLIMLNSDFYDVLIEMARDESFNNSICITDRLYEERFEMELILRLLAVTLSVQGIIPIKLTEIPDLGEFLTESMRHMADLEGYDWNTENKVISEAFSYIYGALESNSFRKYLNGGYKGGFSIAVYEVLTTGVYFYLKEDKDKSLLIEKIKDVSMSLSSNPIFDKYSGSGSKAAYRVPRLIPLGQELFK